MMKKIISLIVVLSGILLVTPTQAQSKIKLGHVDFATLYSMMPGLDSVKKVFDDYNKSIQEQYAAMQTELENKFSDYQANLNSMTATQDLQNKESELTEPIISKARDAVEAVAKENGYTYVFNSTEGLLLYAQPSDDIMDMVKAKLKITKPTPKKGAPAVLPQQ